MSLAGVTYPAAFCAAVAGLAGCGTMGAGEGPPRFLLAALNELPDDRFAIEVQAQNTDGYLFGDCVAAGHAHLSEEERFRRDGGGLTDEFRVADGVRTQTVYGALTYSFVRGAAQPGDDALVTGEVLADCTKRGIPTGLEEAEAST